MTSRPHLVSGLLLLPALLAPRLAAADDASAGVPLPALRSVPAGSVRLNEVKLVLARDRASLTLSVQPGPAASALRLDFERFGWLGGGETYPDRQFPELEVSIGDQKVTGVETVRSFVGSREITSSMAALRIDPWAIANTPPFVTVDAIDDPRVQALVDVHALEAAGPPQFFARWQSQRRLAIPLPGAAIERIVLRWKPRPALALMSWGSPALLARLRSHCADPVEWEATLGQPTPGQTMRVAEYVVHLTLNGQAAHMSSVDIDPRSFGGIMTLACRTASRRVASVLTIEPVQSTKPSRPP